MIIYPSLDIKDGKCVKVVQGNLDDLVVLDESPTHIAKRYEELGFKWLHVVDLDGAVEGKPVNIDVISELIEIVDIPLQIGGGIRSMEHFDLWFERGAAQVVISTMAINNPELLQEACEKYPGQVVVSLDVKDGYITTAGWYTKSNVKMMDLALKVENMGVAALIYTDVDLDGAQLGINADVAVDLAWSVTIPVIVNGGVASMEDLTTIKMEQKSGLAGVIVGTSLHDGRIDAQAALRLFQEAEDAA